MVYLISTRMSRGGSLALLGAVALSAGLVIWLVDDGPDTVPGTSAVVRSPVAAEAERILGALDGGEGQLVDLRGVVPISTPDEAGSSDRPLGAVNSVDVVPHVWRGDNSQRMYVAPEFFEDWYADETDDDLRVAKALLDPRMLALTEEAANAWFDMGFHDGDEFLDMGEAASSNLEDSLHAQTSGPEHGLVMAFRTEDLGGVARRRSALLPWEEHQGLYDLKDEVNWLTRELWRRQREGR